MRIRKKLLKIIDNMYLNDRINLLSIQFRNGKRKEYRINPSLKEQLKSLRC